MAKKDKEKRMRVLWICNIMLPMVATHLNRENNVKEGWLTGLAEQVLFQGEENGIELALSFPVDESLSGYKETFRTKVLGKSCVLHAYGFVENTARPDVYEEGLESALKEIMEDFKPDVIHCFGTEYPHTLAAARVCAGEKKLLVGIQGVCYAYAQGYLADIPKKICRRFLLRDFLKQDNIMQQQAKFFRRGDMEKEALGLIHHVTGRTEWDERMVRQVNPDVKYHFMYETLRKPFYEGQWEYEKCRAHSIFISQGDYPIKGLHYILQALPEILLTYPDTHVYVAGQSIIRYRTWKEKLKISSYGKYLLDLIKENNLQDKITFLGRLNAEEMKSQYLASHTFLCPSVLENSPNSLGEAMMLGVPCVSAEVGGIPSLFSKKEGILYQGNDAHALAQAILAMWQSEAKQKEYSLNARKRALCNHDATGNYHTLLQIYNNIHKNS